MFQAPYEADKENKDGIEEGETTIIPAGDEACNARRSLT